MSFDSILAESIAEVVARFGPRHNTQLSIAPVIADRSNYPETVLLGDRIEVHIVSHSDVSQTHFQLSHESVHCLYGDCRRDTLYFEEGLANHAALTTKFLPRTYRRKARLTVPPVLMKALIRFERLNATDAKVMRLREIAPGASDLTPDMLREVFDCAKAVAEALCERMPVERPTVM